MKFQAKYIQLDYTHRFLDNIIKVTVNYKDPHHPISVNFSLEAGLTGLSAKETLNDFNCELQIALGNIQTLIERIDDSNDMAIEPPCKKPRAE